MSAGSRLGKTECRAQADGPERVPGEGIGPGGKVEGWLVSRDGRSEVAALIVFLPIVS